MSFLEVIFIISSLCVMPMYFRLYFLDNIHYKKCTLIVCVTQTIIGTLSDTYNLYYSNKYGKLIVYMDRLRVSCISFPVLFLTSYFNELHYQIYYFIIAILFWINQHLLFRINKNINNLSIKKFQLWNHILWHTFMGIGCYKSLDKYIVCDTVLNGGTIGANP